MAQLDKYGLPLEVVVVDWFGEGGWVMEKVGWVMEEEDWVMVVVDWFGEGG